MPIFAYQSLNSNSSSSHGISASNSQPFTVTTHNRIAADSNRWMFSLPTSDGVEPHIPIHGPANLIAAAPEGTIDRVGQKGKKVPKLDDNRFLSMVEGKARQVHQNIFRAFQGSCDVLVFGELDGSHTEWSSMKQNAGNLAVTSAPAKACNCFSIHTPRQQAVTFLSEGEGWIAIKSLGIIAVFVHVPNKYASNERAATDFYRKIKTNLLQLKGGGVIDVIMGDTNQPRSGFTQQVLNAGTGQSFADAYSNSSVTPFDSYNRSFGGTNSVADKMYDIALYNTATVSLKRTVYLSQCTPWEEQAIAVTDHMGIAVEVTKRKAS